MAARSLISTLLFAALLALPAGCGDMRTVGEYEQVTIKGHAYRLEVADDDISRTVGLMHRESIPEDGGMLFIFPDSGLRSFWMGYCLVDIDVIFLDARGRVTATHRMKAQTPRGENETIPAYERRLHAIGYSSRYPAQFAIELRSGWLDRLDLRVEDRIEFDLDRLKIAAR